MALEIPGSFSVHVILTMAFVISLQGKIFLPPYGSTAFVKEGSDVEIPWTYNVGAKVVAMMEWVFTNDTKREVLATLIPATGRLDIISTSFPNINVTKPATLVLKNVTRYYSGRYRLALSVGGINNPTSDVVVIVEVYPRETSFLSNQKDNIVTPGSLVIFTCNSTGRPEPNYVILRHGCEVISRDRSFSINSVESKDAGSYQCVASNYLENTSAWLTLAIACAEVTNSEEVTPTAVSTPTDDSKTKPGSCENLKTEWHIIFGTLLSGVVFGALVSFIAMYYCLRLREKKDRSNVVPRSPEKDKTYKELDLDKFDSEENYQSLRSNSERNNLTIYENPPAVYED